MLHKVTIIIQFFSLSGHVDELIYQVGLLPACNHQQVPFAYKMFTDERLPEGYEQSKMFKQTFSIDVKIDFIGVWSVIIFLIELLSC